MRSANGGGLLGDIKTMNPGQGRWSMPGRQNTACPGVRKEGSFEHWRGQREQKLQSSAVEERCHKQASLA